MNPLIDALGWTLLHFFWQGTLIAAGLWVLMGLSDIAMSLRPHPTDSDKDDARWKRAVRARVRYLLAAIAMTGMLPAQSLPSSPSLTAPRKKPRPPRLHIPPARF